MTDGDEQQMTGEDLGFLISQLSEKDDKIRYQSFLTLQTRSESSEEVYSYWDTFAEKLNSDNSYQRSIGIMLLAENIRWDREDRFSAIADEYLSHCNDGKFITSRQTIQSIGKWVGAKPKYWALVKETLFRIDIGSLKDTQRKLILMDIIGVLADIQKIERCEDIAEYFMRAMTGGILDKKAVKQIGLDKYL